MAYRTILVGLDESGSMAERAAFALTLAERMDARLVGILANPPPFMPSALGEGAAYAGPEIMQAQQDANAARSTRLRETFAKVTSAAKVPCLFVTEEGSPGEVVAGYARVADLTIVGQSHGEGLEAIAMEHAEEIVVGAGGPVLVLPRSVPVSRDFARSWLVAWDGGKEAARALAFALPFLQEADRVVLVAAGEEYHASADAAGQRLSAHGVKVEMEKLDEPEGSIGELLLAIASTKQCTAMVMGAYGHSRFRELIMGGATITIVRDAPIPVLFSA
jgi:nucleotide-binding universal stress UspA family protein